MNLWRTGAIAAVVLLLTAQMAGARQVVPAAPDFYALSASDWKAFQRTNELWALGPAPQRALADYAASVLRNSRDEETLRRALWVLARVGVDRSAYARDVVGVLGGSATALHEEARRTIGTLLGDEAKAAAPYITPLVKDRPRLRLLLPAEAFDLAVREGWSRSIINSIGDPAEAKASMLHEAIETLRRISVHNEQTRGFLVSCVRRAELTAAAMAAEALGDYGPSAVPDLRSALSMPLGEIQASASRALEQIGPAAAPAVPQLLEIVRSAPLYREAAPAEGAAYRNFVAPLAAARALLRIGVLDADVCTTLIEQMKHGRREMQRECVWSAGWLGCGDDTALSVMRAIAQGGVNPGHAEIGCQGPPGAVEAEMQAVSRRARWMAILRRDGAEALRRDMVSGFSQREIPIDLPALEAVADADDAEQFVPVLVDRLSTDPRGAAQGLGVIGAPARAAIPAMVALADKLQSIALLESIPLIGAAGQESAPTLRRLEWSEQLEISIAARRVLRRSGLE